MDMDFRKSSRPETNALATGEPEEPGRQFVLAAGKACRQFALAAGKACRQCHRTALAAHNLNPTYRATA